MPFCPNCRTEYRDGFTYCSECDATLVEALPAQDPVKLESEQLRLAELASFPNASEAEMIQELLEGNGISTVIRGDVDPIGATSGAEPATLLVDRNELARAREIYDAFFAGDVAQIDNSPIEPQ